LRLTTRTLATIAVAGLLAAGCSRAGTTSTTATAPSSESSAGSSSGAGNFGTLIGANTGPYLCGENVIKLPAGFPAPLQLSSVGESLSDLK
jgi:hypothetical protein